MSSHVTGIGNVWREVGIPPWDGWSKVLKFFHGRSLIYACTVRFDWHKRRKQIKILNQQTKL